MKLLGIKNNLGLLHPLMRVSSFVTKSISYLVKRISWFVLVGFMASLHADELNLSQQQQKVFEGAKDFAQTLHPSKTTSYSLRNTLHEIRDTNLFSRDTKPEPRIFVFVSFSLGETAIKQYAREAKKAGASLVFRGLIGDSLKTTALRLQKLAQETQASFLIDPTLFKSYGIEKVPAVVVVSFLHEPRATNDEPRSFDVIYGLTTLDYALKRLQGQPG